MVISTGLMKSVLEFFHVDRLTMPVNEWLLLNLPDLPINKGEAEGSENVTHALPAFVLQVKNCLGCDVSTSSQTQIPQRLPATPALLPPQGLSPFMGTSIPGTEELCSFTGPQTSQAPCNCSAEPATCWDVCNNKFLLWEGRTCKAKDLL